MSEKKTDLITINNIDYDTTNLNDTQKTYIQHINDLDRKINNALFQIDQLKFGKEKFVEKLIESLENV